MRWTATTVVLLLAATTATTATAQERKSKRPTVVISFEEDLIYGTLQQPAGDVVSGTPAPPKHKSLVQPRKTFRREMLGSLHQL